MISKNILLQNVPARRQFQDVNSSDQSSRLLKLLAIVHEEHLPLAISYDPLIGPLAGTV